MIDMWKIYQVPKTPLSPPTLVKEHKPNAIILGCSDARVPVELIFDQGLGDLFVIRVAGNVVAPSQIGSIEFAAEKFGTRLVVVLGHSHCGAVTACVEALNQSRSILFTKFTIYCRSSAPVKRRR